MNVLRALRTGINDIFPFAALNIWGVLFLVNAVLSIAFIVDREPLWTIFLPPAVISLLWWIFEKQR